MKVFEVIVEVPTHGEDIVTRIEYVTSEADTLKDVVDYFTIHCREMVQELKGVKEVLTIVHHLEKQ